VGNEARNAAMVEQYAAGATLEQIGRQFGVTRERVRQIVKKSGATTALEARQIRREVRASDLAANVQSFLDQHRAAITELAGSGTSRAEVEARFSLLFPEIPPSLVREALSKAAVLFDVDSQDVNFSDAVIEAGVWFALARDLDLDVDRTATFREADLAESREVAHALQREGIDTATVAEILCRIHAGRRHARTVEEVGLSARRYNQQREQILAELGLTSARGAAAWPPTSMTVTKRLGQGSWADAQIAIGLTPDVRGRPRGLLAFSEDDYTDAVKGFLGSARATGRAATFDGYVRWVENEERAGRRWPSGPSVRLRYTSWNAAKRVVAGSDGGGVAAARSGPEGRLLATVALHDAQEAIERLLVEMAAKPVADAAVRAESFVRSFVQDFEHRRREWLRSAIMSDSLAVPRRLAAPDLARRQRTVLEAGPSALPEILTDMYLDRILSSGPRSTDGWLRPDAQAELDRVAEEPVLQFTVLREYRNLLTHGSAEARERLAAALRLLGGIDDRFTTNQPLTSRTLGRWLAGNDYARLRLLLDSVPSLWRAMVVAGALLEGPAVADGIG
jgi:hypothetical protein